MAKVQTNQEQPKAIICSTTNTDTEESKSAVVTEKPTKPKKIRNRKTKA